MVLSRGPLQIEPLFTTADIGIRSDASVEHVIKVFLNVGEAIASRWMEMPRGVLLLQMVAGDAASGAIYLYDREEQVFYLVDFTEGYNDSLTAREFEELVAEYDLLSWAANPQLAAAVSSKAGTA